jgi:hypothetical protein
LIEPIDGQDAQLELHDPVSVSDKFKGFIVEED